MAEESTENSKVKPKIENFIHASVTVTRQADGSDKYFFNLSQGDKWASTEIDAETAQKLASTGTVNVLKSNNTTETVELSVEATAQILNRATGIEDFSLISFDTPVNKPKEVVVQDNWENGDPKNDSKIAEVQSSVTLVNTVVEDYRVSTPSKPGGKVDTGYYASTLDKPNDTGKGGSGGGDGAAHVGTGQGANTKNTGSGLGIGSGVGSLYGNGVGKGNFESKTTSKQAYKNAVEKNQGVENDTIKIDTGSKLDDKAAAAAYARNVTGEINHIFFNDFYSNADPIPAWSFSVDFIPLCMTDPQFAKLYTFEDSKTLTKAVLKITANEKTVNTQNLNYMGMQHPFFTKMPATHGDLQITFAEDEFFTITTILKNVLKYASYAPHFPTNKVYGAKKGAWGDELVEYAASDDMSPQYRLNATDLSVDSDKTASLVNNFKFVFDIVLKLYKAEDAHIFADDIHSPRFVYHFHKCWLKNIDGIDLNYDNDDIINRNVVFSYQYVSSNRYQVYAARNKVSATPDTDVLDKGEEMTEKAEQSTSKAPAPMTPEAAKQFVEETANLMSESQGNNSQAAAAAAQMSQYSQYFSQRGSRQR